uniref:Uncharacterized protein n=1 Tax=Oryza nivara TaxID=4536 RepID=A0A0E0HP00_ORYNI
MEVMKKKKFCSWTIRRICSPPSSFIQLGQNGSRVRRLGILRQKSGLSGLVVVCHHLPPILHIRSRLSLRSLYLWWYSAAFSDLEGASRGHACYAEEVTELYKKNSKSAPMRRHKGGKKAQEQSGLSPECVSEVPSMREREVANLGSDGVLVLLIRLGLAN